ncbi:MAG: COP23 domain-containing protein, partial [Chloroflexi bacterium]|nr:COP23 domain-containing protein [Chloroflexota bacterium]
GKPVLRIRAASGGYPPIQRAQIVADRINQLSQQGHLGSLHVGSQNGEAVVMSGTQALITATPESARSNGATPEALADSWAQKLRDALGGLNLPGIGNGQSGDPASRTYTGSVQYNQVRDVQHTADKFVPIVSFGTGTRLGGAMVTGPSYRVAQVAAVGQIEGKFKNIAEARVLVPVSNPNVTSKLERVPEVSVYAVADYRLP